ncbi:spermidine synthase [Microbispora sp. CA-135349]|uniref:spermidine synthase n=1 Tax=Microbispora sp. CA-135349 TaxID=3239953 RepID=UPI003D9064DE
MGVALEAAPYVDTGKVDHPPSASRVASAPFLLLVAVGAGLSAVSVPMLATMVFPGFGAAPMVWCTCLLFVQAMLCVGCCCAHVAHRLLGVRAQVCVLAAALIISTVTLPFAVPAWSEPRGPAPVLWLLLVLTAVAGAPLSAVGMAGSLVVGWHCGTGGGTGPGGGVRLCVAGATGGMLALMAYPFVIEPMAEPVGQAGWWSAGYAVFAVLTLVCGWIAGFRIPGCRLSPTAPSARRVSSERRARRLFLAFVPSALVPAATGGVQAGSAPAFTAGLVLFAAGMAAMAASIPISRARVVERCLTAAAVCSMVLPWTMYVAGWRAPFAALPLTVAVVGLSGLVCYALLAGDLRDSSHLSEFLLVVSLGGALGAAFSVVAGPMVFGCDAALPVAVTALAILPLLGDRRADTGVPVRWPGGTALVKAVVMGGPLVAVGVYLTLGEAWLVVVVMMGCLPWCVLAVRRPQVMATGAALTTAVLLWYQIPDDAVRERTLFGAYQVHPDNGWRVLSDGTTLHGYQYPSGPQRTTPVSYYGRPGPLGDLFTAYGDHSARLAVVGLGTGVVAAYGRPGQRMDFYEADPAQVDIATERFTYLTDSSAAITLIGGDPRRRLAQRPAGAYGMVVVDAFTTATPPLHLLTRQALETFARALKPGGVLAFHLTNPHVDLVPSLVATARAAGLTTLVGYGQADAGRVYQASAWVAAARGAADLTALAAGTGRWQAPATDGSVRTDAHPGLFTSSR